MICSRSSAGLLAVVLSMLLPGLALGFSVGVFRTGQDPIPINYITALTVDADQTTWIGTGGGGLVARTSKGEWRTIGAADGFEGKKISSIAFLGGEVLVASEDRGVYSLRDGRWTVVLQAADGKLDKRPLLAIYKNEVWAAAMGPVGGLFHRKPGGEWERVRGPSNETLNDIRCLQVDDGGTLWMGTMNNGLFGYQGGTWSHYGMEQGLPHFYVEALAWDGDSLWLAVPQSGLVKFEAGAFKLFTTDDGLPSKGTQSLMFDDEKEQLWIGTERGLARFDGSRWVVYGLEDGLPGLRIFALAKGDNGIWIGTDLGLALLTP